MTQKPDIMTEVIAYGIETNNTLDDVKRCINIGLYYKNAFLSTEMIGDKMYVYFVGRGGLWHAAGYKVKIVNSYDALHSKNQEGCCMTNAEISTYIKTQ